MGKLAIMSDLHVDINKLFTAEINQLITVLQSKEVTHLHLAGDTANTINKLLETINHIESANIPVTFNFGNHELPDLSSPNEMEEYPDERFLNLEALSLNKDLVLLGVNGWYDYSFALETDHKKIEASKNLFWYDRLIERGASDPEIMTAILKKLEEKLITLKDNNKKVILATHFVPRKEFIHYHIGEYERWNQINPFLGSSEMGALVDKFNNIQHVVFGHTHRQFEKKRINATDYSAKPFGYFYEWQLTKEFMLEKHLMSDFNPLKVRKLLRGYEEEFETFKQLKLNTEFANKMVLIPY